MSAVVVDTSVWIEFFRGRPAAALEHALEHRVVVLPPLVVSELVSGCRGAKERRAVSELVADLQVHETPLQHWIRVGELRRTLAVRGASVSTPDAHVAQCAIDLGVVLLARDHVFVTIAEHSGLRVHEE